jgi:hypothetical protein
MKGYALWIQGETPYPREKAFSYREMLHGCREEEKTLCFPEPESLFAARRMGKEGIRGTFPFGQQPIAFLLFRQPTTGG